MVGQIPKKQNSLWGGKLIGYVGLQEDRGEWGPVDAETKKKHGISQGDVAPPEERSRRTAPEGK